MFIVIYYNIWNMRSGQCIHMRARISESDTAHTLAVTCDIQLVFVSMFRRNIQTPTLYKAGVVVTDTSCWSRTETSWRHSVRYGTHGVTCGKQIMILIPWVNLCWYDSQSRTMSETMSCTRRPTYTRWKHSRDRKNLNWNARREEDKYGNGCTVEEKKGAA